MRKRDVIFFLPSLKFGGAERALLLAAKGLSECDDIAVQLITQKGGELEDQVGANIEWICLNKGTLFASIPKIFKLLLNRKAVLITTLVHCNVVLTTLIKVMSFFKLSKCKVFVRETTNLFIRLTSSNSVKLKFLRLLVPAVYNVADGVIFPNRSMFEAFERDFSVKLRNYKVIYNPSGVKISLHPSVQCRRKKIIVVGRLEKSKGVEDVLTAFSKVLESDSGMSLDIVGDGHAREELEALAETLEIEDKVSFKGFLVNPFYVYKDQSVIYVLASYMEGMPNGLIEALSCGIPCVSYDCDYGPREIFEIFNISNKYLIPVGDISKLALLISEVKKDLDYFSYVDHESLKVFSLDSYIDCFKKLL